MSERELLLAIQAILDGEVWDADTALEIAELMEANGFPIRDPFDMPEVA
jgi:hypothetical protein